MVTPVAVVFDLLVGVEDIGADLAAPLSLLVVAGQPGDLGLPLGSLQIGQSGGQDLHGPVFVLVLAALILA